MAQSSNNADSRKDVPFSDIFSHCFPFRVSKTPKKQFWPEYAFSSQTREIEKRAYYQNYCIDSSQILHSDEDHQMPFMGGPVTRITNPRWRTAAIFEKSLYLGHGSSDFHEIWLRDAVRPSWPFLPLKNFEISKIQHGCIRHLEKLNADISPPWFERFRQNLA